MIFSRWLKFEPLSPKFKMLISAVLFGCILKSIECLAFPGCCALEQLIVLTVNINKAIKALLHKRLAFIACVKNKSTY
jgi:hypothetical protein